MTQTTQTIKQQVEWTRAKGNCGFNLGDTPVYGAYINGVALFAWKYTHKPLFYTCVVTGHMTCGGKTMGEAQEKGVYQALACGVREADRRLSRKQFAERMEQIA